MVSVAQVFWWQRSLREAIDVFLREKPTWSSKREIRRAMSRAGERRGKAWSTPQRRYGVSAAFLNVTWENFSSFIMKSIDIGFLNQQSGEQ